MNPARRRLAICLGITIVIMVALRPAILRSKQEPAVPSKKVRRATNPRRLTADEADEAGRLRELVEKDKDEIIAEGRRFLAEKHRRQAEAPSAAGDDQGAAVE
jgi:hypothetical protein